MNYKMYVDFRERHENSQDKNMITVLDDHQINYELTQLAVGDYVLENLDNQEKICVERKIISDFVGSIYDQRLGKELLQMEQSYTKSFIIIVGDWKQYNKEQSDNYKKGFIKTFFTLSQRLGIFASIACRYNNVKLLCVENDDQFIELVLKLLEKSTDGKLLGELSIVRKKSEDLTYFNILTSFPNLGSDKAKLIMDKYVCFKDFYVAILNDVFEVKGIGVKTIEMFKKEFG